MWHLYVANNSNYKTSARVNNYLFAHIYVHHCKISVRYYKIHMGKKTSVPFKCSVLNKWIQVSWQCNVIFCTALVLHGRREDAMNTLKVSKWSGLFPASLCCRCQLLASFLGEQ